MSEPSNTYCLSGHSFTARYTTTAPTPDQIEAADVDAFTNTDSVVAIIESLTNKIYMCDICDVCGLTVGLLNLSKPMTADDWRKQTERDFSDVPESALDTKPE